MVQTNPATATEGNGGGSRILIGIIIDIVLGVIIGGWIPNLGTKTTILGDIFLNSLKMIVVPLVMLSMIVGITGLGDIRNIGPIGGRTVLYYMVTTGISVLIGIIVTWAAVSYRMRAGWIALLNLALFVFAAARYGAPNTGVWVLPGPDTFATLATEIEQAVGLIRHGVEPVQPTIGLVVILAGVFWLLGALLAFGLLSGRPFVALAPPLVFGLQLLTVELQPSSNAEIALFVLLVAATTLAVGLDEHDRGAGRMARPGHHPSAVAGAPISAAALALLVLTVVGAIGISSALASQVPTNGNLTWRTGGSLTAGYYGGVTYNPYVQIHRGLVSQSDVALFTARLDGAVDPTDVYYRLITLDTYDDGKWYAAEGRLVPASDGVFEDRDSGYAGPTVPVNAALTIHALRQEWLPAPYAVTGVGGEEAASFRAGPGSKAYPRPSRDRRSPEKAPHRPTRSFGDTLP